MQTFVVLRKDLRFMVHAPWFARHTALVFENDDDAGTLTARCRPQTPEVIQMDKTHLDAEST